MKDLFNKTLKRSCFIWDPLLDINIKSNLINFLSLSLVFFLFIYVLLSSCALCFVKWLIVLNQNPSALSYITICFFPSHSLYLSLSLVFRDIKWKIELIFFILLLFLPRRDLYCLHRRTAESIKSKEKCKSHVCKY